MYKLHLRIDELAAGSFATAARAEGAGTVRGRMDMSLEGDTGDVAITPPVPVTQEKTCPYTCRETCGMTVCVTNCSCITTPCATCV